jgi:hypothetical protein
MEYKVLSPWGEKHSSVQGIQPRLTTLDNKIVGLFAGHKGHWPIILEEVSRQLKTKFPKVKFSAFRYPKDCVDLNDDPEYKAAVTKWLKGVDTVITGYGDATSCTLFLTYNTAFIEKAGKPAVIIMNRHFANVAGSGARSRGLNSLRKVPADLIDISGFFSLEGVVESVIRPGIAAVIKDIIAALTKPLTKEEKSPVREKEKTSRIAFTGDLEGVNRYFYKNGWSYGMPIIPPTEAAVKEMLTGTDLPADHVVAVIPPMSGKATVEKIAINAVMAGCLPTHMPVLIAAVEAMMDYPKSKLAIALEGYTCSVASWAPMLIVNGPIRHDIHVNSGVAAMSPYYQANAAIGHALGYLILNVGGVRPGVEDMSFIGHEGRCGMCLAENEEASPWNPMHVDRGFKKNDSAVTIFWPNSRSVQTKGKDAGIILKCICDSTETFGFDPGCGILMLPASAKTLSEKGLSRKDVISYIVEYARRPAAETNTRFLIENNHVPEEVILPLEGTRTVRKIFDPEHLLLVVVGEPYYPGMTLYGGGGDHGSPVTKKIQLPANWNKLVAKYKDVHPTYKPY